MQMGIFVESILTVLNAKSTFTPKVPTEAKIENAA